jgi:hypothetical protein
MQRSKSQIAAALSGALSNITCSDWSLQPGEDGPGPRTQLLKMANLPLPGFGRRLSELAPAQSAEATDAAPSIHVDLAGADATPVKNGDPDQPDGINKSVLVLATPRRYRNREHLRYVAQQACLICGRKQSDAPSSARTGTGWALMAPTMLTVLTQNRRPCAEIAAATRATWTAGRPLPSLLV